VMDMYTVEKRLLLRVIAFLFKTECLLTTTYRQKSNLCTIVYYTQLQKNVNMHWKKNKK